MNIQSRLTEENIKKAKRYLTQCLEGLQFEKALINLATVCYPGKPLSNSILLHELREAEEFEKLGYDFFSEKLEIVDYQEKLKTREQKIKAYKSFNEPHLRAVLEQYEYLSDVAKERGYNLSAGTILKFSPISSNLEIKVASEWNPKLISNLRESNQALDFILNILREEHLYGKIFLELFELGKIKSGIYLYENYADKIKEILKN